MTRSLVAAVSGADGFIGRNLCQRLRKDGFTVRPIYGPRWRGNRAEKEHCLTIDFNRGLLSQQALEGCDVLIHLAGIAHQLKGADGEAIERINGHLPSSLALIAHQAGVRRFVFLSSLAVTPLLENRITGSEKIPALKDKYAAAKLLAESRLREVAGETGIETVIVRPPAVYGPGAPGRLSQLMRLIRLGVPFPCAHNKRSLIGVGNLVNLLVVCSHHAQAAGETFPVSDCELSTNEIIRLIAQGMGRTPVFLPIPKSFVMLCLNALNQTREASHYFDSFVADSEAAGRRLGWRPLKPASEGLIETGAYFAKCLRNGAANPLHG
ncbi:MAG: NAD-dependent epimerase/dehydratase family protein [Acidobacteriaceae bacterium]|nr:NAD-dependent epimerase/dehydratase family protein [Acidobacteriaceae bacterium]